MFLHWLKCFVWVALIIISNQQREEGSDVNYSTIANNSIRRDVSYSVKPSPYNCACHNQGGEIYNLAPLQNTNGTPSLTVNSTKYPGQSYHYNPCSPFKLGRRKGCRSKHVAICWVNSNSYNTIGDQEMASCAEDESDIPSLVCKTRGKFEYRDATVRLKCDESKTTKEEAVFEILNDDNWTFLLTHLCSCGNGCPINTPIPTKLPDTSAPTTLLDTPPTTIKLPDSSDQTRIIALVAVSAVTTIVLVPFFVWLIVRRQNRKNNEELLRLLGNRAVEPGRNPIPQRNSIPARHPIPERSAGCSQGASRNESDVNSNSANA